MSGGNSFHNEIIKAQFFVNQPCLRHVSDRDLYPGCKQTVSATRVRDLRVGGIRNPKD